MTRRDAPFPPADVAFRDAAPEDAQAMAAFAAQSFVDTFAQLYPREDLEAFLAEKFGEAQQRAEIEDANAHVRLALADRAVVGFCHTCAPKVRIAHQDGAPLELYRLYVAQALKGAGVAQALMADAIAWARARGADALYLSVWENNIRAQRFYRRFGFTHAGEHGFMVGRVRDRDFIWRLDLGRAEPKALGPRASEGP